LPSVKDSLGNQSSEHNPLSEKKRAESVCTLGEEGKAGGAIRVSRYEVQVDSGDVPQKAKPDEESHVPTQKDAPQEWNADKHIPDPSQGQVPASAGIGVPG